MTALRSRFNGGEERENSRKVVLAKSLLNEISEVENWHIMCTSRLWHLYSESRMLKMLKL